MSEMYEVDWLPPNDYTEYWETKDKQLVKYSEMTDRHLINAYYMMSDKLIRFINKCMSMNEELEPPIWVQNAFEALEKELDKRGLLE